MKLSGYKKRTAVNGAGDTYGTFREGKQISPDRIGGKTVWIQFTHLKK